MSGDVQRLLRDLAPQALGVLVRRFGDFGACEDAVQEALLAASEQWTDTARPENPRAWLVHVAIRRMTDHLRSQAARRNREALVVAFVPAEEQLSLSDGDDSLELLFLCCHPALSAASAIALTLRAVGGLTTAEIARAFLVPEATMAARISRAKQTLREAGATFEAHPGALAQVAHVLYLMFSEGYTASAGTELHRPDLSTEALRLARLLRRLVPEDPEVAGLLALMLLTDARRAARTGPSGELVPLDEQDRALWDRGAIAEGTALIEATFARGAVGPYQLQAAIAAVHDAAPSAEATDWQEIVDLYGALLDLSPNPMVALSHAVATAMVHGPAAGLARLDTLAEHPQLREQHRLDAVTAHLLERAGEREAALVAYDRAASRATNVPERDYLLLRAARLRGG